MVASAAALEGAGFEVVRFDFPPREFRMPVLKQCIVDAVEKSRDGKKKLVIGGRSMGGRAASMLAADGFQCDGLLLLAYPLHPAGKPEKLRDAHLAGIRVPVLCFNGTKDPLCRRDLMEKALDKLAWRMHWLEGATHSFRAKDYPVIAGAARDWLARLG
jgi:predicted alpha/beta-hydrolase family hydrolase